MSNIIHRADHCGSLVRPEKLRTARLDYLRGRIGASQLADIEDECILAALKLQRDVGLGIYSDGEFRRDFWLSAVSAEYFEGMENEGIDYIRHQYLKGRNIQDRAEPTSPSAAPISSKSLNRGLLLPFHWDMYHRSGPMKFCGHSKTAAFSEK